MHIHENEQIEHIGQIEQTRPIGHIGQKAQQREDMQETKRI